jgi:flagellar basal body-associated protein FliL
MATVTIVVALVVIAIAALAIYSFVLKPQPEQPTTTTTTSVTTTPTTQETTQTTTTGGVSVTGDESYVLDDQIAVMLDESLASESAEQTQFNQATEGDISSDISQFYY